MKRKYHLVLLILLFNSLAALSKNTEPDTPSPTIVFIISRDPLNYGSHLTIPPFAKKLKDKGFKVKVVEAKGNRKQAKLPDIRTIKKADLLVVFCRRLALRPRQMKVIKEHIQSGKPVVGLRSANHAFSVRDSLPEGYVDWWDFVPDVLGCENRGHGPNPEPVQITHPGNSPRHPILNEINFNSWTSSGQLYRSLPLLDPQANIILEGETGGHKEPVAWTRFTKFGGPVFYTTLGEEEDFDNPQFISLLINAIQWILNERK